MDELLSVGTIVKIKNAMESVRTMIIGYYPFSEETETMYEYSGIIYPQGITGDQSLLVFDSEDVEEVVFQGYTDEEGVELRKALPVLLGMIAREDE